MKAVVIEGALIFDDKDITFDAEYIFVAGGRLQVGTRETPLTSKVVITLHGTKESKSLPHYGNKVIAVREGILDIHGTPVSHVYSRLDSTADKGDT